MPNVMTRSDGAAVGALPDEGVPGEGERHSQPAATAATTKTRTEMGVALLSHGFSAITQPT